MQEKFSEIISSETPALVDSYAEWCAPCKILKPILEDLKHKIGDKAKIIKIDIDKNPTAANTYNIRSVPTLLLFKNGKIIWQRSGVVQANELARVIQNNLNNYAN